MKTTQDDMALEFAATAQDILARLAGSEAVAAEFEKDGFSPRAWTAVAEAGWLDALVSESAGGAGLSLRELGPIFTAVGRHLFPGPLAEHAVAGALAASAARGAAQERLLAALGGDTMLAVVDAAAAGALGGMAPQLRDGRLSGGCEQVRFAAQAGELLVVAEADGGPVLVLVDAARAHVQITTRPSLDPVTLVAAVTFDSVRCEDDDVVVGGDAGDLLARIRSGMRVAVACELSGIADHVLTLAVDYAKERHQFGRPIGSFQALQHILAEMVRETFGLSHVCREATRASDAGRDAIEDAALVAKAHAAEAARSVTEDSLQVHGGIAFTVEHQLHRYYKHVLFLEGFYGGRHEIHQALGRRLLTTRTHPWPAWR